MFSYQIQLYENEKWQDLTSWARPFTDGTALDDSLDAGCINLSLSTRSEPIKPFTPIRIIIKENGATRDRIFRLVASTKRTRRTFAPSVQTLYDWTINTIELTKQLERRFIGTLTSTKYLHTDYASGEVKDYGNVVGGNIQTWAEENTIVKTPYSTPAITGTSYKIYPIKEQFSIKDKDHILQDDSYVEIITVSGDKIYTGSPSSTTTIDLTQQTKYIIRAHLHTKRTSMTSEYDYNWYVEFSVLAFSQIAPKTQPTITSVCERLLFAGVTRRMGNDVSRGQEYKLDTTFAKEYENVSAPEFSFTNCTLFEALAQVGGYIHAIPRLIPQTTNGTSYYVTFDKLGGSEQAPTMPPVVYQDSVININDWCGTIASPAQNLCNTTDEGGAITEFGGDYITVRAEDGQVEINGDNIIIRTSMPMQKLVKLECGYISNYADGKTPVGDITAYTYEDAEYSVLSSYWGTAYPYSKAWALRWKQGSNVIDGLTFRPQQSTSTGSAFANTAILNIINAKCGLTLKAADFKTNGKWYRQLAFRVTYVPIVTARVQAVKPVASEGGETQNALVYNQGANVAETSFYGEKMRGAIARLGQDVEQRTYDIETYSQMPKVGQILDGKYIATIDAAYDRTRIRITLTLTKNFNQLSEYIGLNSNYRLYDISEKQSVERHIHYAERVMVGKRVVDTKSNAPVVLMVKDVPRMIKETITSRANLSLQRRVQTARVFPLNAVRNSSGMIYSQTPLTDRCVFLPVASFPFGTSICFNFSYFDNYGAGYQSSNEFEDEANKAAQRLVPYTDEYGEFSFLHVKMTDESAWTPTLDEQKDGGKAMLYPEYKDYTGKNDALGIIDTAPDKVSQPLFMRGALIIEKDSREKIDVTYQLNFVATDDNYIVGSGLTTFNRLVNDFSGVSSSSQANVYVIWLDHPINALNKYIDATDQYVESIALTSTTPYATDNDGYLYWKSRRCPRTGGARAFAVCKMREFGSEQKYELLFGQNVEIDYNGTTGPIYFSTIDGEEIEELLQKPVSVSATVVNKVSNEKYDVEVQVRNPNKFDVICIVTKYNTGHGEYRIAQFTVDALQTATTTIPNTSFVTDLDGELFISTVGYVRFSKPGYAASARVQFQFVEPTE